MSDKRALITGVTGQDGSYLAELLLEKGYEVYGLIRHSSVGNRTRIAHLTDRIHLIGGDLTDETSLLAALKESQPQEVYNLAAQSFVPVSVAQPILTAEVTGLGVTRLLDAIRAVDPTIRFYQASTSEMFGHAKVAPQNEDTPLRPRSPYGAAKVYAHWITVNYRESYGLHASCGICYNHESERRPVHFVTRKVTRAVAAIKLGLQADLRLGTLSTQRDWGYAKDYVDAMWRILQQETPDDYVIASGVMHSIEQLVETAFGCLDLNWRDYVAQDERFLRPSESDLHQGDFSKATRVLGWTPTVSFEQMIANMVENDLNELNREK